VGEIRDHETAEIAVQSALTGHLVFSTLHTNDAASAVTRLVDIGVEPFLISSSVLAILAQRLVRVLCEHCRAPYTPEASILKTLGVDSARLEGSHIHRAVGCEKCFHSGFRGRAGIFEMLRLDKNIKRLILTAFDSNQILAEAGAMTTLRQDGIAKVLEGKTTFEEVLRVAAK
jgi:general secretion pathway protein E